MLRRSSAFETQFNGLIHCSLMSLAFLVIFTPPQLFANVITFEGYPDGTSLTSQYAGLTF